MNIDTEPVRRRAPDILVVEDDNDLRAAICESFSEYGMSAIGLGDGASALAYLLSSPPPRLVVRDVEMPIMDGWELLEHMRGTRLSRIPVVVLSAFVQDRVVAWTDGIQFQVTKPFDPAALVGFARRFCRR